MSGNVYGGVLITNMDYVKEVHGPQGFRTYIKKMQELGYKGPRKAKEFKVSQTYPANYAFIGFKAYHEVFGNEAFELMCREIAKRKGIVGWFISWAGTPAAVVKKAKSYWPNFYDFGRLEGRVLEPGKAVLDGYEVSPFPLFCRVLTHYYVGVLEYVKAAGIEVKHTLCVHAGGDHCRWELKWD